MGLFSKTVEDIEKYRAAGRIDKIVKALEYKKDENVVTKAMETLSELSDEKALRQIVQTLIHHNNKRVSKVFEELIINKDALYIDVFIKCLVQDIRKVARGDALAEYLSKEIDIYRDYLKKHRNVSIPLIIRLLENHNVDVRINAAELLEELKEDSSKEKWQYILDNEERTTIITRKFRNPDLEKMRSKSEIPISEFQGGIPKSLLMIFSSKTSEYQFGITNRNLYIAPNMLQGEEGYSYALPLSSIIKIEGTEDNIDIYCDEEVKDPRSTTRKLFDMLDKSNNAENILSFHISFGGAHTLIEIFGKLKHSKMKNTEILEMAQTYDEYEKEKPKITSGDVTKHIFK